MSQGFGDGSILPEDLRHKKGEEEDEVDEQELILDGGLPRYTTASVTSDLVPVKEGMEMTVDDDEEEGVKEVEEQSEEREKGMISSLPRKPPPSWEEWKLSSSRTGSEKVRQVGQDEFSNWNF